MPGIYKKQSSFRKAVTRPCDGAHPHSSSQLITPLGETFRTALDAKDVLIFCDMAFKYTDFSAPVERRISPSEIGKKEGLDEKTVRLRVKRVEEEGFIKYYQAIPNLVLFHLQAIMYGFQARDISSKHQAIESLRETPGVVEIIDTLGESFSVTLAGRSNEEVQRLALETRNRLHLGRAFKA